MKIGVIGGGQLGRMLALAGTPLGMQFVFLDPAADACAGAAGELLQGAYDDPAKLKQLAERCDVITYEFENVPTTTLDSIAKLKPFHPPVSALGASQDRLTEKTLFRKLGIPTPAFQAVDSLEDLALAISRLGTPGILKTRRLGYDGRGQFRIKTVADMDAAWQALQGAPLIYEAFVAFTREVSIIGARNAKGEIAIYPLTENEHRNGVLHLSLAPYKHAKLQAQAERYLKKLLKHFDYVGLLTIEFFVKNGQLVANEMAPRVHNSGHWTIEGAETSQFENHLRAIAGLPLGSTAARGQAAMVNLVGFLPTTTDALKLPQVHLHHYGKSVRPGRKVGHLTTVAGTAPERAKRVARMLKLLPKTR